MRERHPVYVWFMMIMVMLALLGAALLIFGSMNDPGLPRLIPGIGVIARYGCHG